MIIKRENIKYKITKLWNLNMGGDRLINTYDED